MSAILRGLKPDIASRPKRANCRTNQSNLSSRLIEAARTREWIGRAMLIDPDNILQRYNLACALTASLNDDEGAMDLLAPYFEQAPQTQIEHAEVDPDMNRVRDHPRFKSMVAAAKARLAAAHGSQAASPKGA